MKILSLFDGISIKELQKIMDTAEEVVNKLKDKKI